MAPIRIDETDFGEQSCFRRRHLHLYTWLHLNACKAGEVSRPSPKLLARGVDGYLGAAADCGASPGSADSSHLPAASASAEELIAAIGLESRHLYSRRHLDSLQELSFQDRLA
jgi:hypothetical protein